MDELRKKAGLAMEHNYGNRVTMNPGDDLEIDVDVGDTTIGTIYTSVQERGGQLWLTVSKGQVDDTVWFPLGGADL